MVTNSHIRAVEGDHRIVDATPQDSHESTLILDEHQIARDDGYYDADELIAAEEDGSFHDENETGGLWLPIVAASAAIAWTGYFFWSKSSQWQSGLSPSRVSDLLVGWAVPLVLIAVAYILYTRSSTREIKRYGDAANSLRQASLELEHRLNTVNRELSLAREFLTIQSRELEYVGRSASERLSDHATVLQSLIGRNNDEVEKIATVSEVAAGNMEKIRDDLPVIANSARDVANQIAGAGRGAQRQVETLITGFERLNKFGLASERQVDALKAKLDETYAHFTETSEYVNVATASRFKELGKAIELLRSELEDHEIAALGSIRQRAHKLNDELNALRDESVERESVILTELIERIEELRSSADRVSDRLGEAQNAARSGWEEHLVKIEDDVSGLQHNLRLHASDLEDDLNKRGERLLALGEDVSRDLAARIEELDKRLEAKRGVFTDYSERLGADLDSMGARIDELASKIGSLSEAGEKTREQLRNDVVLLRDHVEEGKRMLDATRSDMATATDDSVRLLELLQASVAQTEKVLPESIGASETKIAALSEALEQLVDRLRDADVHGASLSTNISASSEKSVAAIDYLDGWRSRLEEGVDAQQLRLSSLKDGLQEISALLDDQSKRSTDELRGVIETSRQAVDEALASFRDPDPKRYEEIAQLVGSASARAVEDAVRTKAEETVEALELSSARAAKNSEETADVLRNELARIEEMTAQLETRIDHIRERANDRIDSDFSRRVAVITENLNSSAIDISKAMSEDVSEAAWASYLKGDRGIFTRRAVRLLDNTQAKEIAALYDSDAEFREHVSRYIHDFEELLRSFLATENGNALSVTVLGSDMGKLYVALAQAIERLRN